MLICILVSLDTAISLTLGQVTSWCSQLERLS